MGVKWVASCLTAAQSRACTEAGITVIPPQGYARTWGEVAPGCITDYSVHCFNGEALGTLAALGVTRATLHPELNLAQIRDLTKPIDTEVILYGRIPLMRLGVPLFGSRDKKARGTLIDRKQAAFFVQGDTVYNGVPLYMADKLGEVTAAGVTHGRLLFTCESPEEVCAVLKAYKQGTAWEASLGAVLGKGFTRGKFFSRV